MNSPAQLGRWIVWTICSFALATGCAAYRDQPFDNPPQITNYHQQHGDRATSTTQRAASSAEPVVFVSFGNDSRSGDFARGLSASADKEKTPAELLPAPRWIGITLDEVINASLIADPKIRAGFEAINQANADALTASLRPNPSYTGDAQLLPLTRPFTVNRQGGPPQTDHQINWPIDWFLFGKRAAAMASAATGIRVSEAEFADLVRQRVRDAAIAYFDAVEAKALLQLAREDLENLRRVEAGLRKSVASGNRPLVDLNRARLDVLKSEQSHREAETTLINAVANLRARLGRRDADPTFDIAGNLDAPLTAEPMPVEEAQSLAERNRPDIQSLRLQINKAAQDIRSEMTRAFPQVTPQVGYTRQFQEKAIGFPDASSWMVSLNMTLPFFDRNQGNIAKARSAFVQNTFNLEGGLVDLRAEIVQVVRELEAARRSATSVAGEQLKVAAEIRDTINKSYEAGGRTLLEVLDAQRNYRETYRLYINSRANYWRSVYKFSSAIGQQLQSHEQRR